MSNPDPWTDPNSQQPVVKKKGMSGCMLASLIVGGLGLMMVVACCGIGAWLGPSMLPKIAKGPDEVTATAQNILKLEMLPDFTPDQAMTWDWMVLKMQIADFKHKEGKGAMFLASVKVKMGDPNQAEMQTKQFSNQSEEKVKANLEIQKSETREVIIAGQKVPVTFADGKDKSSGKEAHLVSGSLELPSGRTFFVLRMDEDIWDEEAVLKMLEEAKAP